MAVIDYSMKEQIIKKTFDLVKEKGFNGVSVSEICAELGITRGAFYYYFKTKDEVFDSYMLNPEQQIMQNLMNLLEDGNYREKFHAIYSTYTRYIEEIGKEITGYIYKRNIIGNVCNIGFPNDELMNIYEELIKKGQDAGQIFNRNKPADIIETIVFAAVGIGALWCNKNSGINYTEAVNHMIDIVFDS